MKEAFVIIVLVASAQIPAQADVLNFDGDICAVNADGSGGMVVCADFRAINQSYGDSAMVDVVYSYQTTNPISMQFWSNDYSGMQRVAFGGLDPSISLLATSGNVVSLNSFDVGAWPNADRSTQVTVIDLADNSTVLTTGPITVLGSTPTSYAFSSQSSAVGFKISFGPDGYNVGIDNLNFSTSPIPEPATGALLLVGLAALGWRKVSRRV